MGTKKSAIMNSIIVCRQGETILDQSKESNQLYYVTMNGYLLVPIETPIDEISKMIKEHTERQEHENDCPCCGRASG